MSHVPIIDGPASLAMTSLNDHNENDGRTNPRSKTLRRGTIVFNHRMSTMDCVIFDLSDTGARLRPIDVGMLPDQFELRVLFSDTYQCQLIHKNGDQIGVRFV